MKGETMLLDSNSKEYVNKLRDLNLDARDGLDEDLFLLVSSLVPIANVDMLVTNESGQILLSYRDDEFYGESWHIPGGCMRYGETFEHRLVETSKKELGCIVEYDTEPLVVRNVLRGPNAQLEHPDERGHNVAILFNCRLPNGFTISNGGKKQFENGYLKWFDKLPDTFLKIQYVFRDRLERWM